MILWHMNLHQISPVLAGVDPEIEEGGGVVLLRDLEF